MARNFPEKVYVARSGKVLACYFTEPAPGDDDVQPYFSASLVEELVDEIAAALGEPGVAADVSAARAAVSKAQSSLGVKG